MSRIGGLAFAGCKNLTYVTVDERNVTFTDRDGVLYTADGTILLLYPSLRPGSSYTLDRSLEEIRDMAFYDCVYLKSVHYAGTAEEWEHLRIGSKNHSLIAASKTFSSADGK